MNSAVVAAIIAASVSLLTLIGTLAAQYLARRATSKQLDRTLAEQRTRTLNERFATAAEKLGSDKPAAVRLAGVYAMAGLADDWTDNRQTCVDVLCGYLRMPYEPDPGEGALGKRRLDFRASREVRHTVIRVITSHLRDDAAVSWRGLNFDFTGAVFDGGDFTGAEFSGGMVDFGGATFSGGTVDFGGATFSGGTIAFGGAAFSGGTVDFTRATFSRGLVDFRLARFSGGDVNFQLATFSGVTFQFNGAEFSRGTVGFGVANFSDGALDFSVAAFSGGTIHFYEAELSGGTIDFSLTEFSDHGTVSFNRVKFAGGTVDFRSADFSGGTASFRDAKFSRGKVDFDGASFSGGTIDFDDAEFAGGEVGFTDPGDWSVPPTFPWIGPPPPGVTLPSEEDQSQA
jgi:uncharacterized protein YjbI with pentapeptide repeats